MHILKSSILIGCSFIVAATSNAAISTVNWSAFVPLYLNDGTTLVPEGSVLQLGYFTDSDDDNLFAGDFIALTGENAVNANFTDTAIGANGFGDGYFSITTDFNTELDGANTFPSAGKNLAIRFYDAATISSSAYYNTVSDSSWDIQAPGATATGLSADIGISTQKWESIEVYGMDASTAYTTAVPEPSTYAAIFGVAALGVAVLRRRRRA